MKEGPYKEGLAYEELMIYKSFNLSGYPWEAELFYKAISRTLDAYDNIGIVSVTVHVVYTV